MKLIELDNSGVSFSKDRTGYAALPFTGFCSNCYGACVLVYLSAFRFFDFDSPVFCNKRGIDHIDAFNIACEKAF